MKNLRPFRCLLLTVSLGACDALSTPPPPAWPSTEGVRAFDVGSLESHPAILLSERLDFAMGIGSACGESPGPVDAIPSDGDRLEALGIASYSIVLAEVERLHPGTTDNGWAADHILAHSMERNLSLGRHAVAVRGCDAMRPLEAQAWRALRSWQPAAERR